MTPPREGPDLAWFRRLLRLAFPDTCPEVDLHGLRVPEALEALQGALRSAEGRRERRLRVVCGKGRGSPGGIGILRSAVAGWLEQHGYAGRYRREVDRDGRDGALWVDLTPPP